MTPAIDITTAQRKKLLTLLRQFIPGVIVWAYGSRVKWTARPNSDLDLVVFTTPAQSSRVSELKDALAESSLPFPVDVHVWDEVPERFHSIIRNEYVVLQDTEEKLEREEMPDEWKIRTFGELTDNWDGRRIPVKESERKPGIFPYYGASGIVDYVDKYIFEGEYLLVAEDGENLRTQKTPIAFLARGKFWVNNHAHIVTGNALSDTRFLMYALNNGNISGFLTGSTMPKLTQGNMNRIPILVPPLSEQRVIASVLGALDDKIELNRWMNETLEAVAQALFQNWFVEPTQTGLPKGWREMPLTEAIEVNPPRPLRRGIVAPYLDMANMPTRSARALEVADREFSSGTRFKNGDTLVARITPCLENGKTCFVDFLIGDKTAWGSTEYIVLKPKRPLPPEFAYFLARTEEFRNFMISNMTGTTGRQRVPVDCLNNFRIAVPTADIAEKFGKFASAVFSQMKAHDEQSRTLAALRDALLPKLLSGELRVRIVENNLSAYA